MCRVGQNHIYTVYIRLFFAGTSSNIRSYTVYIYGSGQPYTCACVRACMCFVWNGPPRQEGAQRYGWGHLRWGAYVSMCVGQMGVKSICVCMCV